MNKYNYLLLSLFFIACTPQDLATFTLEVASETAEDVINTEIYKHTRTLDEAFDKALDDINEQMRCADQKIGFGYMDPQDYPRNGGEGIVNSIVNSLNDSNVIYTSDQLAVTFVTDKPTGPWQIAVSEAADGSGLQVDAYGEDWSQVAKSETIPYDWSE